MPKFSIVVPVYNRPDEISELLETLVTQSFTDFEVIVVEDGSTIPCKDEVLAFSKKLDVSYHRKENEGQGYARNYGYQKASGDYFIVFDSDCLVPDHYLEAVHEYLYEEWVDAYGGPDTFHPTFTALQKAISHTMTSTLTTGGMRGGKVRVSGFHPRSFNMGISREVYEKTGGYKIPFMGEDMEFSRRIIQIGFKTALFPKAFVYHKRRTSLGQFSKQLKYFGRARINITRFFPDQLSILHFFPVFFMIGSLGAMILSVLGQMLGYIGLSILGSFLIIVALQALTSTRSFLASLLSPLIVMIQFYSYSIGLLFEWIRKKRGINPNMKYIELY